MTNSIKYQSRKRYPYVVQRMLSAVYRTIPVIFLDKSKHIKDLNDENPLELKRINIVCSDAFNNGALTEKAKEVLVKTISDYSVKTKFKMCIVFGESNCVYCEPDGSKDSFPEPPRGSISV